MTNEAIFALTSLTPTPERVELQCSCIQSWRDAGLQVRSFNHSSEIPALAQLYEVEFVPVERTSAPVFGQHYIPINAMLDWAAEQLAPVMLINSDIQLRMSPWELMRARWLSDGGLCFFVRYNHDGDLAGASRELHGIDAFLLHGCDAYLLPESFLSMGQPFWDFWIPYFFVFHSRSVYSIEFPVAFHRNHETNWSWDNWHRCSLEFDRMACMLGNDRSFEACMAMTDRARQLFLSNKISVSAQPMEIREWVQQTFNYDGAKTFLELGAHRGTDTVWMAAIPDVFIYAFEPDPRNSQPPKPNVIPHKAAIADRNGRAPFILSQHGWGQEWTHSSSIKRPKNHLSRHPVTFGETIEVDAITLDTFCHRQGLGVIDFIWANVQGAEGEMIRGGKQTLARTRYLYTEYSDDEPYEGQVTLREIMDLLPDFRVLELWLDNVLLENRSFSR